MKSELRHLLDKLKAEYPDFQNIIIAGNGTALAIRQHGAIRFESLDAMEAYAWPQPPQVGREASEAGCPSAPSPNPS